MYDAVIRKIVILLICKLLIVVSIKITYKLIEEQPPPVILGNLVDDLKLDFQRNSFSKSDLSISFFPMQQPGTKLFKIENFLLKAIKRIDREELCRQSNSISKSMNICSCSETNNNCYIKFIILLIPYQTKLNLHEIIIELIDINDNPPIFIPNIFTLRISEGSEINTYFNIPKASDKDNIVNDVISYSLFPISSSFSVIYQNNSLYIRLKETLNRESIQRYDIKVLAKDKVDGLCNTGILKLAIFVEDINDCTPQFLDPATKNISLPESSVIGQVVYVVQATDCDKGNNSVINFEMNENEQDESLEYFFLNKISGEITIKKALDREVISGYVLIILAKDFGSPSRTNSMTINILITDINDNPPLIKIDTVLFIPENRPPNSILTTFTVEDFDEGDNAKILCELFSPETVMPFSLDLMFKRLSIYSYKIKTKYVFDREKKNFYKIVIHCQDSGLNNLSTDLSLLILVEDENDFIPKFTNAHNLTKISLMENTVFPNPIFKFQAYDPDIKENGKLSFSIISNMYPLRFFLNSTTGNLFTTGFFDYENINLYTLWIKVEDSAKHPLYSVIQFLIQILNENDNPPEIINLGDCKLFIPENISINSIIYQFQIIDRDNEKDIQTADTFLINNENHFVIMGMNLITTDHFNREQRDKYQISIITRDKDKHQLSNIYFVEIFIEDINDCVPEFIFPSKESAPLEISSDVAVDFTIAQISARDADSGNNAKLTYQLHNYNRYFYINPSSGYLRVRSQLKTINSRQISLNISVADNGYPSLISYTSVFVNISRNPLLKSISTRFDIFLQRSSLIIAFIIFVIITLLMLMGIILIVRKFMKSDLRRTGFSTYRSNDPNLCAGHLLIIDRTHPTPERLFQDSNPIENEDSINYNNYMMTTF